MLASVVLAAQLAVALDPYATLADLRAGYASRRLTTESVVRAELARIGTLDRKGPRLNSLIAVAPNALAQARALDAARRTSAAPLALDGAPMVLKDNIEWGPLPTTAGSLALVANTTGRDAPVAARLVAAGAVILGKANLSEWANFRSRASISGWSAVGGLVRNPYALDRNACGSSSGSAVAVAAGFAVAAIGTETDGSIVCPAAATGVVGLKPTLGLVPRTHIVPISPEQDTPGPIARNVEDVAAVLQVIAGADPADPATAEAHKADYTAGLKPDALRGVIIGVLRGAVRNSPGTDAVFEQALKTLKAAGAALLSLDAPPPEETQMLADAETAALQAEFKAALPAYLATAAPGVRVRSLADVIAFNAATPAEMALFGQENFAAAASRPSLSSPAYKAQRETARRLARQGLDRMFDGGHIQAIVAPTGAPAALVDPVNGARWMGSPSALPAVAGYPHLTVPMGEVSGLPVGLSFIGPAWSEAQLLAFGYAFQQAAAIRLRPTFAASVARPPAFDPD